MKTAYNADTTKLNNAKMLHVTLKRHKMKNLDECIKKVIGISEDANKLTPMDKGECKLVAEEWAAQQVKNLTIPVAINWVATSDRTPPENVSVLCYNGHRIIQNSWMQYTGLNEERFIEKFTHWAELPKLPYL